MLNGSRETKKFDDAAAAYNELLNKSLDISGERFEYFAEYKIARLKRLGFGASACVLDFGCGIGNLTELLSRDFGEVAGFDPSTVSLGEARKRIPIAAFYDQIEAIPQSHFDLAVLAGVLHHIPTVDRVSVLSQVRSTLKPGGMVVIFEHNPLNPLTRRAVDACPFDNDAILLSPGEVRAHLKEAKYEGVCQAFIVFFPKSLSFLRPLEPCLRYCPLGAQTMTTATRHPGVGF